MKNLFPNNNELPQTAINWKGEQSPIEWPKNGRVILQQGEVYLLANTQDHQPVKFWVVYGLQVKNHRTLPKAAADFELCVAHYKECQGCAA